MTTKLYRGTASSFVLVAILGSFGCAGMKQQQVYHDVNLEATAVVTAYIADRHSLDEWVGFWQTHSNVILRLHGGSDVTLYVDGGRLNQTISSGANGIILPVGAHVFRAEWADGTVDEATVYLRPALDEVKFDTDISSRGRFHTIESNLERGDLESRMRVERVQLSKNDAQDE